MLASHAALCASTGSDEMSVFQTLSAGNIGQLEAPGSGVPAEAVGPRVGHDRTHDRSGTVANPAVTREPRRSPHVTYPETTVPAAHVAYDTPVPTGRGVAPTDARPAHRRTRDSGSAGWTAAADSAASVRSATPALGRGSIGKWPGPAMSWCGERRWTMLSTAPHDPSLTDRARWTTPRWPGASRPPPGAVRGQRQGWRFVVLRSPAQRAVVAAGGGTGPGGNRAGVRHVAEPAEPTTERRARTNRATYELHDRAGEFISVLFSQQRYPTASELLLGGSIFPAMQNFLLAARAHGTRGLPHQLGLLRRRATAPRGRRRARRLDARRPVVVGWPPGPPRAGAPSSTGRGGVPRPLGRRQRPSSATATGPSSSPGRPSPTGRSTGE